MKNWIRHQIIPRLPFLAYWGASLILAVVKLFAPKRSTNQESTVLLEAGARGWELIEYKELYQTACEYLDVDNVYKTVIDKQKPYLPQLKKFLQQYKPTHYVYDPRTGSPDSFAGLLQSFQIAVLLTFHGVIPIAILADFAYRRWRTQCSVVTALKGIVVTFISPKLVGPICPHKRFVGPSLMPLSIRTFDALSILKEQRKESEIPFAMFSGSLYEPRTTILNEIDVLLKERNIPFYIKGRVLGSPKFSDEEYWGGIIDAAIVVTTADQAKVPGTDWTWFRHLLYRYIEVPTCGSLLVAPIVEGVEQYFTAEEHFVSFDSPQEAAKKIEEYLKNPQARHRIASQGYERVQDLVKTRVYWSMIDSGLGSDGFN